MPLFPATTLPYPAPDDALRRVRREYVELPRLRLTFAQARRLWTLNEETCRAVLDQLVDEGFLYRMSDGRFAARTAA